MDYLGLKRTWYSFERGGWCFIVLDNIAKREFDYYAAFEPEQIEWLKADLAASKAKNLHICVVSHIPLHSVAAYLDQDSQVSPTSAVGHPKRPWR